MPYMTIKPFNKHENGTTLSNRIENVANVATRISRFQNLILNMK